MYSQWSETRNTTTCWNHQLSLRTNCIRNLTSTEMMVIVCSYFGEGKTNSRPHKTSQPAVNNQHPFTLPLESSSFGIARIFLDSIKVICFYHICFFFSIFQERTKNAQFVIISLRNNMFELADRLVGIFKTDNCTKSVTINPQLISSEAWCHWKTILAK